MLFSKLAAATLLCVLASACARDWPTAFDDADGGSALAPCDSCGHGSCECVPKAPLGYKYVRLITKKYPPSCPVWLDSLDLVGVGALDTGCEPCDCGLNPSPECLGFNVTTFADPSCADDQVAGGYGVPIGGCETVSTGVAFKVEAWVSSSTCQASAKPRPPLFAVSTAICAHSLEPAACGSAGACLPSAGSEFEPVACIAREDPNAVVSECPPEYPKRRTFSSDFKDARQCFGCSCTADGPRCSQDIKLEICAVCGDTSCASYTPDAGWCFPLGPPPLSLQFAGDTSVEANCTPSGVSVSTGTVAATGERVVCCR